MTKQNQEVGVEGIAVQAGGNARVTVGLSAAEVQKVLHAAFAAAMPMFEAQALRVATERTQVLEQKIVERLATEPGVLAAVLETPDFQFAVHRARQSAARSEDPAVADTLVDVITDRAKQQGRTRLALTLNDAADKVGSLTKDEFAVLSITYILRHTRNYSVLSFPALLTYIETNLLPFVDDLVEHNSSCEFLESHGCGQIQRLGRVTIRNVVAMNYGGLISDGFTEAEGTALLGADNQALIADRELFVPCLHDRTKLQLNAINKEVFQTKGVKEGLQQAMIDQLWSLFESRFWSDDKFDAEITGKLPRYEKLSRIWKDTALGHFEPTSLGIAIGHANARRVIGFQADLSIWIK